MAKERVPTRPVSDLVRAYVTRQLERGDSKDIRESLLVLFERMHYEGDYGNFFNRIYQARQETIDQAFADRILCALDRVEAWYTEPTLHESYSRTTAA